MDAISLDAVEMTTGISRRTLWRRVTDGAVTEGGKDARGRTTMALADVLRLMQENTGISLTGEYAQVLVQADAGDAGAQADIGALLHVSGAQAPALYWLHLAAAQDNADAMQWLGTAYAHADPPDDNLAIAWIAKAAALGHVIARRQMDGLLGAVLGDKPGAEPG